MTAEENSRDVDNDIKRFLLEQVEERNREAWVARILRQHGLRLHKHERDVYQVTDAGGIRITEKLTLAEVINWIEVG